MGEKVKNPLLQKYIDEGKKIYSFSKLSSFHNCEFEYWNTYVDKTRGQTNIYSYAGGLIHEWIEAIYRKEMDATQLPSKFEDMLIEAQLLGYKFPNESIGQSWTNDVRHFITNFKPIDSKFILEKHIVFPINEEIVIQSYLDAIQPSEKGKGFVNIIDWKTSSRFSGKKLDEAGRQLLTYKLGLELTTNVKVDKVMWFMIKYLYVCWMQKNKKIKRKMCNRGKWVKEMRNPFEKELLATGMLDFEVELLLENAIAKNNIDDFPEEIKSKYTLEDCFISYEATPEKEQELKEYVIDTVANIESKSGDASEWKPVEITQYDSFYCATLCSHRGTCPFYKEFLDKNSGNFQKKEKKSDLDDFFS